GQAYRPQAGAGVAPDIDGGQRREAAPGGVAAAPHHRGGPADYLARAGGRPWGGE
ncbi:unnamed protein product, partial [Effrenium voratum]